MHKKIWIHIVLANSDDFPPISNVSVCPIFLHSWQNDGLDIFCINLTWCYYQIVDSIFFNIFFQITFNASTRSHQSECKPVNIEKIIYN